ncbi:uncharacterized protein TRAVEDRAFT_154662, partial [Trametes versicolor FP-101664 SS1]|uniref:uncharacterized protein n=1 Tax=Trametes versicolor (strain FP-101664) TaxID=717944 RepID=UPI000462450F
RTRSGIRSSSSVRRRGRRLCSSSGTSSASRITKASCLRGACRCRSCWLGRCPSTRARVRRSSTSRSICAAYSRKVRATSRYRAQRL